MLISLVGMPASGKTTLGKCLAKELQYQFIDLDHEIEKYTGQSIRDFFRQYGETKFREVEHEVLLQNLHHQDAVLAVGGGTPCFLNNMEYLVENSLCVYVLSDLREATLRICAETDQQRPLFAHLSEIEVQERLEEMYEKRHPFYAKAHIFLARGI